MRSAELTMGRRWVIVLEPGEEVVSSLTRWCAGEGVTAATVDMFFGAFRSARLIASHGQILDPEPPLLDEVEVTYLEGIGSGTVSVVDGAPRVHLHIAAGAKDQAGAAYAGHLLSAETHYTVEIIVHEVVAPAFGLRAHPAHGVNCLIFE